MIYAQTSQPALNTPSTMPDHIMTALDMANVLRERFSMQEQNEVLGFIASQFREHREKERNDLLERINCIDVGLAYLNHQQTNGNIS